MFISYTIFNSYKNVKSFIRFLFIISTISALYAIKQQWFGLFDYELKLLMSDPLGWGLIFVGGEIRKASTMADPAQFGIVMSVCAVFFMIIAINQLKPLNKTILLTGSIFMIMAMGYSGTRTAYAILVVAMAFYMLLNINKKSTRVFAMVAIPVILFILYAPIYGNKTIQRFRTTFVGGKDESYKVRILSRAFIQPYIRSHPIGGGLGTTGYEGARDHPGHYLAMFQPDSSYVRRGAETGWSGLAEICILYFIVLYTGIKGFFSVKNEQVKTIAAACISGIYAFYIAEFAQPALGQITDSVVYYPMLAILLRLNYIDNKISPEISTT
jgi:O-antigen ligase